MTVVDYGPDVAALRRRLEAAEAEVARLRAVVEAVAVTLTLRDERNALSAELARLYRDFAPTEPPAPEGAVRVRIAVAVDAEGEWDSAGASAYYQESVAAYDARREMGGDPSRLRLSWVEAWVPRPEAEQVVEGRVEERE